jgi:hypothetical protein
LGDDGKLYLNGSALGGGVTGGAPDEKKLTTTPTVSTPTVSTPNSSIEDAIAMLNNGSHKQNADDYMNQYKNHTFNFNANALYNQYAPQYQKQARLGMEDAIGRASALTGGYGSSYAQAVGQQAYYNQMDKLDDRILDLYNIAYAQYRDEKNDLLGMANYYNGLAQQDYDNAMKLFEQNNEDDNARKAVSLAGLERVEDELKNAKNMAQVNAILDKFRSIMTEEQEDALYDIYRIDESSYTDAEGNADYIAMLKSPNLWDYAYDGGRNLLGIDRDAELIAPNGDKVSAIDLVRYLREAGASQPRKTVKKLLETLGING